MPTQKSRTHKLLLWIGGVLAALMVKRFVEPIIDWLYVLPGSFFNGWIDGLYASAARGTSEWAIIIALDVLLVMFAGKTLYLAWTLGKPIKIADKIANRVADDFTEDSKAWSRWKIGIRISALLVACFAVDNVSEMSADFALNSVFNQKLTQLYTWRTYILRETSLLSTTPELD